MKSADHALDFELPKNLLAWMLKSRWPAIVLMVFGSLIAALVGLAAPFFQKLFVDRLTHKELAIFSDLFVGVHPLWLLSMAFGAMILTQWLSTATSWVGIWQSVKVQERFGLEIYKKALSMRLDQATRQPVGETVSIYATDVTGATAFLDQTIPLGAGIIFPFVCAPIAVQVICGIPVRTTVMLMLAVLSISITLSIRQSRFFQAFKRLAAERTALVNEWVQNLRLLRILGWVDVFEQKIFNKREEETVNRVKMVTNGQMMGSFGSSVNFFLNLVAVMTLGRLKGDTATPGDYFALLWIFGVFLSRPFRQVPWIFTFTFDGWTSLKRIENYLNRFDTEGLSVGESKVDASCHSAALSLRNLSLKIGEIEILHDISFDVEPGEFVAIVGEVGSGKSLLLMSLLGETAAACSTLTVNGAELRGRPVDERRKFFGFVPQDGFVMSASLRENVAFRYDVKSEIDPAVIQALRAAQFDPMHENGSGSLPDGVATEIGERGVNLSGGQRQRVGLARASYLRRPVILLDDALSAVDVETERALFETLLFGEWREATRIMVTHRLSVLERVDRILFLRDGRLIDQGRFQELARRNDDFRGFVSSLATAPEVQA